MSGSLFQYIAEKYGAVWPKINFTTVLFVEIAIIVTISYFAARYLEDEVACDWARHLIPAICVKDRKKDISTVPPNDPSSVPQKDPSIASQKLPAHLEVKGDVSSGDRLKWVDGNKREQMLKRANEQWTSIQTRKRLHLEMLIGFYKAYIWSILAVLFSAPFAAIAVVELGKKGLMAMSITLRATFFATTITAAVAAAIPSIFGHQSSISGNQALFLAYEDLDNLVKTYFDSGYRPATKDAETTDGKPSKIPADACIPNCQPTELEIRKFIAYVDEEMKRLNRIAIAIDSSKIPAFTINSGKS